MNRRRRLNARCMVVVVGQALCALLVVVESCVFFPDSERKTLSPGFCERIQLLGDRYRSMAEMASFDVLVKYFFGFLDGIRNLQVVQTYARVG